MVGKQYQEHNPSPGPVYAGGGYTPVNKALAEEKTLEELLEKFPDIVNDISTGGAQPLHMCGMSKKNQGSVALLVSHGGDIEALDTYGFTPLHRFATPTCIFEFFPDFVDAFFATGWPQTTWQKERRRYLRSELIRATRAR